LFRPLQDSDVEMLKVVEILAVHVRVVGAQVAGALVAIQEACIVGRVGARAQDLQGGGSDGWTQKYAGKWFTVIGFCRRKSVIAVRQQKQYHHWSSSYKQSTHFHMTSYSSPAPFIVTPAVTANAQQLQTSRKARGGCLCWFAVQC